MKKIYSTIMMLAMMVAALGFTACGDDDEEDDGGTGNKNAESAVTINGKSYQNYGSSISQSTSTGLLLYLSLLESENPNYMDPFTKVIGMPGYRVSELKVGQICNSEDLRAFSYIYFYEWDVLSGSILIKDIKETEVTVQFRNLEIEYQSRTKYIIDGTVTCPNGTLGPDNKPKPFDET